MFVTWIKTKPFWCLRIQLVESPPKLLSHIFLRRLIYCCNNNNDSIQLSLLRRRLIYLYTRVSSLSKECTICHVSLMTRLQTKTQLIIIMTSSSKQKKNNINPAHSPIISYDLTTWSATKARPAYYTSSRDWSCFLDVIMKAPAVIIIARFLTNLFLTGSVVTNSHLGMARAWTLKTELGRTSPLSLTIHPWVMAGGHRLVLWEHE